MKSGDSWILEELIEYRWWMFSVKRFESIMTSLTGPDMLIQYVKELRRPDRKVVWESKNGEEHGNVN